MQPIDNEVRLFKRSVFATFICEKPVHVSHDTAFRSSFELGEGEGQ